MAVCVDAVFIPQNDHTNTTDERGPGSKQRNRSSLISYGYVVAVISAS